MSDGGVWRANMHLLWPRKPHALYLRGLGLCVRFLRWKGLTWLIVVSWPAAVDPVD